jgi:cysteine desulfurase family protein (TIGR01976 family)
MDVPFPVERVRARFPGLGRRIGSRPAVFLDGPAGSQVPESVAAAVATYMLRNNANSGGAFATSVATDRMVLASRAAMCDLLGTADPDEIVFGANMTSLAFDLSRSLACTWRRGDEIVVTDCDHDANVTPWVIAAERAGVTVRRLGVRSADCTLELASLPGLLSERTRLVAIGAASNLVGTIHDVATITRLAHDVGALVFVDAVHHAPHRLIDVVDWDCDFVACSAYKFFGPHVGILWGRAALLRELPVDKLRPPDDLPPWRFMHGTPCFEGIEGTRAAVEYLADLGREFEPRTRDRRAALRAAFAAIERHESALCRRLLDGLAAREDVTIYGITDRDRLPERAPTVAFRVAGRRPAEVARSLAEQGIFCWSGNNYALPLTTALGLEPDGVARVGFLHYNTPAEIDALLDALAAG